LKKKKLAAATPQSQSRSLTATATNTECRPDAMAKKASKVAAGRVGFRGGLSAGRLRFGVGLRLDGFVSAGALLQVGWLRGPVADWLLWAGLAGLAGRFGGLAGLAGHTNRLAPRPAGRLSPGGLVLRRADRLGWKSQNQKQPQVPIINGAAA
jgi:hypothetical protein